MPMEDELQKKLRDFESSFLRVLTEQDETPQVDSLKQTAGKLKTEMYDAEAQGTLKPHTRRLGVRVAMRLGQLLDTLRSQEKEVLAMQDEAKRELRRLLDHAASQPPGGTKKEDQLIHEVGPYVRGPEPLLNAVWMRDWFLHNIGHPFPSKEKKEEIIFNTNINAPDATAMLAYNQVVLWFINTRRRSGWTGFKRKYADDCNHKMMDIAWALQNTEGGTHEERGWSAGTSDTMLEKPKKNQPRKTWNGPRLTLEDVFPRLSPRQVKYAQHEWNVMIERVKTGIKDRVGHWVDEVISGSNT
ncbi:hypothetical protein MVES1_000374 [Malassezia vespertilionis]|uniref:Homeobox domain-containing protein n=1 Tax=Malassezia vespertilionis TaxID=2020962 RepID=A0A2N1JH54_9BASI|nr:uncharacterized protein MVES1_000374 [Malassezia vespertilionis]PKI85869.1 hypothetical protein MVES_000352 [Malassezia vespertilionis]WFD05049.1 hypothetical protein MVES1_000374 [Malassezia vespertilionis]